MSGSLVRSDSSVTIPLSTSRPAAFGQLDVRHGADADQHQVGRHDFSAVDAHAGDLAVRADDRSATVRDMRSVTPCSSCTSANIRPEVVAERHGQRNRVALENGDVVAQRLGGGGNLHADPAGADEHQPLAARLEEAVQRLGVVEGAQVVDAVQIGAGKRQPPR